MASGVGDPSSSAPTAAPSALESSSSSRLDPLPYSHPLSLRIRTITGAPPSSATAAKNGAALSALWEIEQKYGARIRARLDDFAQDSSDRNKPARLLKLNDVSSWRDGVDASNGILRKIDTEKARQCVESDTYDAHEEASRYFLAALDHVDEAIQHVGQTLHSLRATCTSINESIQTASTSTQYLLQHARGIQRQRATTTQNSTVLDAFLTTFTLSPEELDLITSHAHGVGPALFSTIDKLKRIRNESQILLVGQDEGKSGGMRAGIDIIEETTTLIDAAQHKIAKWLQMEMRTFSREGFDAGDRIRDAISRLDNREDLLRPALTTLATSRATLLSTAFHRALTTGGPAPSHLPRPIELHAHDPLRYVGDMLAWVHQAVASERDFLTGIFSRVGGEIDQYLEGQRRPGQRRRGLEGSIDWTSHDLNELSRSEQWIRRVLDRVMEGCCSPLKVRIEHTIRSQEGCITTFRITSFVQFYRVTMERTLGTKAALCNILKELSILAYRAFVGTLDNLSAGLARFTGVPDDDLSAPPPVIGATATLKELLTVHQASLEETDLFGDALPLRDLGSNESADFATIIQRFIQPILDLCNHMGDAHVDKRPRGKSEEDATWERNIFTANCLARIKSVTEPFAFTAKVNTQIDAAIEEHLDAMIAAHHDRLCDESGLRPLLPQGQDQESARTTKLDAREYVAAFAHFETFLASPTLLSSPHLGLLASPSMRVRVHTRALDLIARDYEAITRGLAQSENSSLPQRDVEQVRLLLGIHKDGEATSEIG